MERTRLRKPSRSQCKGTRPVDPALLASAANSTPPEREHPIPKHAQTHEVPWYRVVVEVALHDRLEPLAALAHGIVHPLTELLLNFSQLRPHAGWTNSHLHQFVFQRPRLSEPRSRVGSKIADENRTKLGELIGTVGARLLYEYDFGDGWQHELLLEEVLLGDETFQQTCVAGKRSCPPEDCGGSQGFAELLQALQDANHPSHDEAGEWLGDFVPESFSADEVNRRLRAGNTDAHKSPVDERYGLITSVTVQLPLGQRKEKPPRGRRKLFDTL
jgi:hypothetical protein